MFKLFSGAREAGDAAAWPLDEIEAALKARFETIQLLGEDGPLKVHGVVDNEIQFVVALMQTGPGSGQVIELGFLARFVGFDISAEQMSEINRNLHIAAVTFEQNDIFLMAGMQVVGPFDAGQFNLLIEQWRRDLMVCIHGLTRDQTSLVEAFPAARLAAARDFAANVAPGAKGGKSIDLLSAFLGADKADRIACRDCGGRGKRGLIARVCDSCDGDGYVARRR